MSADTPSLATTMRQHSLSLGACALVAALLLALTWHFTKDRIAYHQHDAERTELTEVLPAVLHDNDLIAARFALSPTTAGYDQLALLGLSSERSAYRATLTGNPSGVILPLETQGYGGAIVLLIGIDVDGTITGVRVLQHAETPGLGDKIDIKQSLWITSFDHRSLNDTPEPLWHVKKDWGDFDQFVGATITPRAVISAVHNALLFFDANKDKLLTVQSGSEHR